jgi:hypothetical protein
MISRALGFGEFIVMAVLVCGISEALVYPGLSDIGSWKIIVLSTLSSMVQMFRNSSASMFGEDAMYKNSKNCSVLLGVCRYLTIVHHT